MNKIKKNIFIQVFVVNFSRLQSFNLILKNKNLIFL